MGLTFPFPFVDVLTLPTDASTGARIVIDGINVRMSWFDNFGFERLVITAAPGADPDILYDGLSYGRGLYEMVTATADNALATGVEEIVLAQLPFLSRTNRRYEVGAQASFSNVTARVIFRLRHTTDGSVPTLASPILEESVFNTVAVGSHGGTGRIEGLFIPASDLVLRTSLTLEANANITMFGTNNLHARLKVIDLGIGNP